MWFNQKDGIITDFQWDSKRGRNLKFERSTATHLVKLAEPESPLLWLPPELRNKIYGFLYEDENIHLVDYGN